MRGCGFVGSAHGVAEHVCGARPPVVTDVDVWPAMSARLRCAVARGAPLPAGKRAPAPVLDADVAFGRMYVLPPGAAVAADVPVCVTHDDADGGPALRLPDGVRVACRDPALLVVVRRGLFEYEPVRRHVRYVVRPGPSAAAPGPRRRPGQRRSLGGLVARQCKRHRVRGPDGDRGGSPAEPLDGDGARTGRPPRAGRRRPAAGAGGPDRPRASGTA